MTAPRALSDAEIVAIRRFMPLIDPTDHSVPWSETLKFAHALLTSAQALAAHGSTDSPGTGAWREPTDDDLMAIVQASAVAARLDHRDPPDLYEHMRAAIQWARDRHASGGETSSRKVAA